MSTTFPAPTPDKPPADGKSWASELTFLAAGLRWLGGAATVGSILGGVGWYIEISQNGLFGIRTELSSDFVTTYLILVAQFVTDCVRVVLSWHARSLTIALVLLSVIVLMQTRYGDGSGRWIVKHPLTSASIVLAMSVGWTTYFAIPTFLFSNMLFSDAGSGHTFDVGLIERATAKYTWDEVVCSRVPTSCGTEDKSYYLFRLESRFAIAIMTLAFLWWAAGIVAWNPRTHDTVSPGLRVCILVSLVCATVLLPDIYGKLILPTSFPSATIYFVPGSVEANNVGKDNGAADFLILREYSDKYILYRYASNDIWPAPKVHISAIRVGSMDDLLQKRIEASPRS
jgi:hypothetical protein